MDQHTSHELAYQNGYSEGHEKGYKEGFLRGFDAGKQDAMKWIHVMEKLPENEQWVLCRMKDGRFRVFQWSYIDWQWNDGLEWYDEYDVTCWMPLPEPPKGE